MSKSWQKFKQANARQIFRITEDPCYYCGDTRDENKTVDHLIPVCKGGTHSWDNLVSCCKTCNSRKGRKTPQQFKNRIRSRMQDKLFEVAMHLSDAEPYSGDDARYTWAKNLVNLAYNVIDTMDIDFPGEFKRGSEQ